MKRDLRITKTENLIREAFLSLIEEKGFSNITITDLSKKANINRKTFYAHYETKEELHEKIIDEFLSILNPVLFEVSGLKGVSQRQYLCSLLNKIKENNKTFSILIKDKTSNLFYDKLKKQLTNNLIKTIPEKEDERLELLKDAYFALLLIVLNWWTSSKEKDANIVLDMILEFFSKKPLELLGIEF